MDAGLAVTAVILREALIASHSTDLAFRPRDVYKRQGDADVLITGHSIISGKPVRIKLTDYGFEYYGCLLYTSLFLEVLVL